MFEPASRLGKKMASTSAPSLLPARIGLLQRKCACGGTSGPSGECEECGKKKRSLQRKAKDQRAPGARVSVSRLPVVQRKLMIGASNDPLEQEADRVADLVMATPVHPRVSGTFPRIQRFQGQPTAETDPAPPSVDRSLTSSGKPLEPALRQDMEQHFGHNFSRVQVHSDAVAGQSARDVNAIAYTVGHNIVFGAGRYAPETQQGRRLIAHELTHVVQQRAGSISVQRKVDVDDFEVEDFDARTLKAYLKKIARGKIEDDSDSDDKARLIVRQWRNKKRKLGPKIMAMLIREMQEDHTDRDDERAILTLLMHSDPEELEVIFAAGGGIDPEILDTDFQGEEEDVLRAFYDRKFKGGRGAALQGSRKLRSRKSSRHKDVPGKAEEAAVASAEVNEVESPQAPGPSCGDRIEWHPESPVPVDITADSIVEFASKLGAALGGDPHMASEVAWRLDTDDRGFVNKTNFVLTTTIIRPRYAGGRAPDTEKALIRRAVAHIRAHEERHRDIAREVSQQAVCNALNIRRDAAERVLRQAVCEQLPTAQEELDGREGQIDWIKDASGAVTDFRAVGVTQNYHDPECP